VELTKLMPLGKLEWAKNKELTLINHSVRQDAFSRMHLPIGEGGKNMINASREEHGPSWRMIVKSYC
jgi:penicillin amidase